MLAKLATVVQEGTAILRPAPAMASLSQPQEVTMLFLTLVCAAVAAAVAGSFALRRQLQKRLPAAQERIEALFATDPETRFVPDPDAWSHFGEDQWRSNVGAPQWREWNAR